MQPPADPGRAAERLIEAGLSEAEFDRLNYPGSAALQDRIDAIIYSNEQERKEAS